MTGSPATRPAPDPREGPRSALVIATASYQDPEFRQLRAPVHDADDLALVLGDADLGAFTVTRLIDQDERQLRREIDAFLSGRGVDDLVLVYLSCHGVLDRRGRLYFAAADTVKNQLASTGVPAAWLLDQLDDCRARRQVLVLDCCFSGAFAHGGKGDADLDLERRLAGPGRGRAVLTASRAGEYSFEGHPLPEAGAAGSVFTTGLVKGLRTGAADAAGEGYVTLEEAYDYAYRYVQSANAGQTPQRWLYGGEGAIVLARTPAWAARTSAAAVSELKLVTVLFADLAGAAEAADQDPERAGVAVDRSTRRSGRRSSERAARPRGPSAMLWWRPSGCRGARGRRGAGPARGAGCAAAIGPVAWGAAPRIGVNTGYVVLEKPRQGSASVAGNAVNVCALLQQAAAPGEVLVGSRTVAAVGGAFEFAAASPVSAGHGRRNRLPQARTRALADATARGGRATVSVRRPRR